MKIDTNFKPLPVGNTAPPPVKATPSPTTQSAEVRLSEAAGQLTANDNTAPMNRAKIEEIKQAISAGKFRVNAEAVADELIATSRQLIESQHKAP